MASPTNFLQWNPGRINQQSDETYEADIQRTGGAITGIFDSNLANKLYYQVTTMVAAIAAAMVNKGYEMQDSDVAALTASLSNLLTKAEFGTGPNSVCRGNDDRLNAPGTKAWFYQNVAPTGWVIDLTPADSVLAVKGGSGSYNVNGGLQAGTWSQPTHVHTGPSHTHSGASHTHTTGDVTLTAAQSGLPAHTHYYYNNSVYGGAGGGETPFYQGAGWLTTAENVAAPAAASHNHGNTGVGGTGNTGAEGTGNTGSSATANTWRPLAQVGIICTKS